MANISVRRALVEDALPIATIHVRTWQVAYRGQISDQYLDSLSIEQRTERWQNVLAAQSAPRQTFVGVLNDAIVGFSGVGPCRDEDADPMTGELYAIYVEPASSNHGVGSALIKASNKYLQAQGYRQSMLWVLETNLPARHFYESKGWIADGAIRKEEIGNLLVTEIRYAIHYT